MQSTNNEYKSLAILQMNIHSQEIGPKCDKDPNPPVCRWRPPDLIFHYLDCPTQCQETLFQCSCTGDISLHLGHRQTLWLGLKSLIIALVPTLHHHTPYYDVSAKSVSPEKLSVGSKGLATPPCAGVLPQLTSHYLHCLTQR